MCVNSVLQLYSDILSKQEMEPQIYLQGFFVCLFCFMTDRQNFYSNIWVSTTNECCCCFFLEYCIVEIVKVSSLIRLHSTKESLVCQTPKCGQICHQISVKNPVKVGWLTGPLVKPVTPRHSALCLCVFRLRELCVKLMFLHPVDYGRKAEELLWRKVYYEVIQVIKTNKKVIAALRPC